MKILLKEYKEEKHEELKFDKILDLSEKISYMYKEKIENNDILKFIDFLIEEIGVDSFKEVYYFNRNIRIWSYIIIFSCINENINLYYTNKKIEKENLLKLNLKNIGLISENLKKKISVQEYEKFPQIIKNLYYKDGENIILSKLGEIYVKNIKN